MDAEFNGMKHKPFGIGVYSEGQTVGVMRLMEYLSNEVHQENDMKQALYGMVHEKYKGLKVINWLFCFDNQGDQ